MAFDFFSIWHVCKPDLVLLCDESHLTMKTTRELVHTCVKSEQDSSLLSRVVSQSVMRNSKIRNKNLGPGDALLDFESAKPGNGLRPQIQSELMIRVGERRSNSMLKKE